MLKVSQVMVVSCCFLESRGASAQENSLLLLNLSLGTKNNKLYLNDVNCHAVIGCVFRFNPYSSFNKCKICKQTVHQAHSHYCQGMSITYTYKDYGSK